MRKQKAAVCLVVAAIWGSLLLPGNSAFAKEVDENAEAEIVQETIIQSLAGAKQRLEFNISGKTAQFTVYAKGLPDTEKIIVTAKLQKSVDGKWKSVETWEKTSHNLSLSFSDTCSLSSKGSYRVQATVTYYLKDNTTETKTTNSATKTYS